MATYQTLRNISRTSKVILVINRCVVFDSDGEAAVPGAGVFVNGLTLEGDVPIGQAVGIGLQDGAIVKVEAGAAIVNGADLMVTATGEVITATSTNEIIGQAVTAASAQGVIFEMQFVFKGTAP